MRCFIKKKRQSCMVIVVVVHVIPDCSCCAVLCCAHTSLSDMYSIGYNGPKNIQANVFFTATTEIVYYTSAVGIVYNSATNTQRFYIGHEDEISCMALHPGNNTPME